VPRAENAALYKRYEAEAEALDHVTFVGRLATYKYYNMDQVIAQALVAFRRLRDRHQAAASAQIAPLDATTVRERDAVHPI
jgi:UDP-galactopyranose mutase